MGDNPEKKEIRSKIEEVIEKVSGLREVIKTDENLLDESNSYCVAPHIEKYKEKLGQAIEKHMKLYDQLQSAEKELAKVRWQWFREYRKSKNMSAVCRKYGVSRSVFYYWKKRIDLKSSTGTGKTSKFQRLISYSRRPKTNPRQYPEETIEFNHKNQKKNFEEKGKQNLRST